MTQLDLSCEYKNITQEQALSDKHRRMSLFLTVLTQTVLLHKHLCVRINIHLIFKPIEVKIHSKYDRNTPTTVLKH